MEEKDKLERKVSILGDGDKKYVCGEEYTIADMAIFPWVACIDSGYNAEKFLQLDEYKHVKNGDLD